ncbi:hypothetical protein BH24ACT24_BH24ACT24_03970 [soil metagenome]
MPFPEPRFSVAHGVLAPPFPSREPSQDERFIAAVRNDFPNLINRQALPAEAPPTAPHLMMASTSSQLAVSAAQADFEVRFYGSYNTNLPLATEYIERKMDTVLDGYNAVGQTPSVVGLIATLHFSFKDQDLASPTSHVLRTHLKQEVSEEDVQDAQAKVALKVADSCFVGLTVTNFESRTLERPLMPGVPMIRVRPLGRSC